MSTSSTDPERIGALDLIRGVAILGILPANIPWFSGTAPTGLFGDSQPNATDADLIVKGLTLAFVDGKFISQLAILFGAGVALQADRAWGSGQRFTLGYLWRTFLLFLLGALHGLLLWDGDILMIYACISVAAVLFVRLSSTGMLTVAGAGLTWTAACLTTGFVIGLVSGEFAKDKDKPTIGAVVTPTELSAVIKEAIDAPPEARKESEKRIGQAFTLYFSRDNQIRIFREGTYGEQLFNRVLGCLFMVVVLFFICGELLACFLFGAFLVRGGFFSDPEVYRRWRPWLLAGGLTLGVPMHVATLILTFGGGHYASLANAPLLCGEIAIAVVYLTLLDRLGAVAPGGMAAKATESDRPAGADELPVADRDLHDDLLQLRLRPVRQAGSARDAACRDRGVDRAIARQPALPALLPDRPSRMGVALPVAEAAAAIAATHGRGRRVTSIPALLVIHYLLPGYLP